VSPLGSAASAADRSPAVISAPATTPAPAALDPLAEAIAPDRHASGAPWLRERSAVGVYDPAAGVISAAQLASVGAAAAASAVPPGPAVQSALAERAERGSGSASMRGAEIGRSALQVHNTYVIVETTDGLMIIDQYALHERILYEELRSRLTDRPLESQRMLIPESVSVAPDRIEVLDARSELLARLGIELTPSGPQSVTLSAFPALLERLDRADFVRDLLDTLSEHGADPQTDTLLHELLDMMACKAAVKAGDPLTPEEIDALLMRRELAERSSNCPHGRPTTLHLSLRELEKQFKRR
jgi:DNA mismatch repair protein MutL